MQNCGLFIFFIFCLASMVAQEYDPKAPVPIDQAVKAEYKGTPVLLSYIKYHKAKDWTLLLTTDLSQPFVQAMKLYQIRWSIEVMFKGEIKKIR